MRMRKPRRLPYGSSPEQWVLLFPSDEEGVREKGKDGASSTEPSALLVFVHGGAWRSGSVEDHADLAEYISSHANITVALIEYRLTLEENDICHPDHVLDVQQGLRLLWKERIRSEFNYDCSRAVLAGHSAGGWMTLSAALESEKAVAATPSDRGPVRSFPALDLHIRKSLRAFIAVSSIFSLVELADIYPSYSSFIVPAFYPKEHRDEAIAPYTDLAKAGVEAWPVAPADAYAPGSDGKPRIHVIHSPEDDLLSADYNQQGIALLQAKGLDPVVDFTSFKGKHDELLHTVFFWQRLVDIVHKETT